MAHNNFSEIANTINALCSTQHNGQFGAVVITATEPRMNKRGNPYIGRVVKITRYTNVAVGVSYTRTIEARASRLGINESYDTAPNKCGGYIDPKMPYCRQHPTTGQTYFEFLFRRNTKPIPMWLIDGRKATLEEIASIESFLPKSTTPTKQIDFGLSEDDVVVIRQPKCDNILSINFGNGCKYERHDFGKWLNVLK